MYMHNKAAGLNIGMYILTPANITLHIKLIVVQKQETKKDLRQQLLGARRGHNHIV